MIDHAQENSNLLARELNRSGYEAVMDRVDQPESMKTALEKNSYDLIISDFYLPGFDALTALAIMRRGGFDFPFIILSEKSDEERAVSMMRAGAHDYILKNNLTRLIPTIEREIREAKKRKEHLQAQEMVKYLAYYDPLTALPNRVLLLERLDAAIRVAKNKNQTIALLLVDLDHFKDINDTLGHHRGDLVLQQVGKRLQSVVRDSDTVSRLGGDEFAVILPLAEPEHTTLVVQKILRAIEETITIEGIPLALEGSIGVAVYPEHGNDPNILLQRADVAMYSAKRAGMGFSVYTTDQDRHTPRQLTLIGQLRQAMEQDQLVLHFQPKINIRTRKILDVEALIRWQHPEYGFIPPVEFIPPAERTGLIKPLTMWVLKTVARHRTEWSRRGVDIHISANLSVRNLEDPQLPNQVSELLTPANLRAGWLKMEITESAIISDSARAMDVLNTLSRMGVRFSIDDFGTGYSSLVYLKQLPVDEIKIDKAFLKDMAVNENDAVIVRSTIELGHNLGLQVVAEGVENKETWNRLDALGCDAAQGYYMCRPIPAEDLLGWIKKWQSM